MGTSDGTTAGVLSSGAISSGVYGPGTISASQLSATNGEAFSFSTSFLQGDALPTSAPSVGAVSAFSSVRLLMLLDLLETWQVLSEPMVLLAITAGGAGSTAVGQFVSEITVID